ncbi:MAG TPA: metallophosphoesterase [Actinomycetota bacterium]
MRIAAVGDLHAGIDSAGELAGSFAGIEEQADLLLLAGDLTTHGDLAQAEVLAGELAGVEIPVVGVLGNHDHHAGDPDGVRRVLERAGVRVLERETALFEVAGERLGVVGAKGFCGGFAGASATEFGEEEMKAFVRTTTEIARDVEAQLASLDTDVRVALLHYSPIRDTLVGEPPEIFPFLGSYLFGEAVDRAGADLVLHGHAHRGAEVGETPGGVPVRNVAKPVLRRAYGVFVVEPRVAPAATG